MPRNNDDLADALANLSADPASPAAAAPGAAPAASDSHAAASTEDLGNGIDASDFDMGSMAAPGPSLRRPPESAESAEQSLIRMTIPSCLLLTVALPAMAIGWWSLPAGAPLKLGYSTTPILLLAGGSLFGVFTLVLMAQVARRAQR